MNKFSEVMKSSLLNRRAFTRFDYQSSLEAVLHLSDNMTMTQSIAISALGVLDVSATGIRLCCQLPNPLIRGDGVKITFRGPSLIDGLMIDAIVRHCRQVLGRLKERCKESNIYHLGCEFVFSDKEHRSRLVQWSAGELAGQLDQRSSFFKRAAVFFFEGPLRGWKFHPVQSFQELDSAHALLYQEYLRKGYLQPNASKRFFRFHTLLPTSQFFVATNSHGAVKGTLTFMENSLQKGLPCEELYPEEINRLRQGKRKIAEVGMLALDKSLFKGGGFSLGGLRKMSFLFQLFRSMIYYARCNHFDNLVIMVNPNHLPIYERLYFKVQGGIKTYHGAGHAQAIFMCMDIRKAYEDAEVSCPAVARFFSAVPKEDQTAYYLLSDSDLKNRIELGLIHNLLTENEILSLRNVYQNQS